MREMLTLEKLNVYSNFEAGYIINNFKEAVDDRIGYKFEKENLNASFAEANLILLLILIVETT